MEIPAVVTFVLAVLTFLIGGGTIGKWLGAKLAAAAEHQQLERFSNHFAKTEDLNGLRLSLFGRLDALEASQKLVVGQVDLALTQYAKLETNFQLLESRVTQYHNQLIAEALTPLQEVEREIKQMGREMSAQTALLEKLWQLYTKVPN